LWMEPPLSKRSGVKTSATLSAACPSQSGGIRPPCPVSERNLTAGLASLARSRPTSSFVRAQDLDKLHWASRYGTRAAEFRRLITSAFRSRRPFAQLRSAHRGRWATPHRFGGSQLEPPSLRCDPFAESSTSTREL